MKNIKPLVAPHSQPQPITCYKCHIKRPGYALILAPMPIEPSPTRYSISDVLDSMLIRHCQMVRATFLRGRKPNETIQWLCEGAVIGVTTIAEAYQLLAQREQQIREASKMKRAVRSCKQPVRKAAQSIGNVLEFPSAEVSNAN